MPAEHFCYDWQHYLPLLEHNPGGIRHGSLSTGNECYRFRQSSEEAKARTEAREKSKRSGKTQEDILYEENPF